MTTNLDHIDTLHTQVAVVGGGGAGLRAALAAAEAGAQVTLLCKGLAARSGATAMAGSSIQMGGHPHDISKVSFEDIRREGRYLGDENLIQAQVNDGPDCLEDLLRYGIKFLKDENNDLQYFPAPGLSLPRNVVIKGNGFGMGMGLRRALEKWESAMLLDDMLVCRLFIENGRICGLLALDMRRGKPLLVTAQAVVLATGGYQELWRWTDAEPGLTGDGAYLAYKAGAELVDLEMMQFYPTAFCHPPQAMGGTIGYEDLLHTDGCGGTLLNGKGDIIQEPASQLPLRDELMMRIFAEIDAGRATPHGGVYIDLRRSKKSREEMMQVLGEQMLVPYNNLADFGIDILETPLEVKPFTHYLMGGVRINEYGESNVAGLFAAGEAGGNVQGANRISGNGLAESQVFGKRAGQRAALYAAEINTMQPESGAVQTAIEELLAFKEEKSHPVRPVALKRSIKHIMNAHVNHNRDTQGLQAALKSFAELRKDTLPKMQVLAGGDIFNYEWQEAVEAQAMLDLAELVAASALAREESRGHHIRRDYPESHAEQCRHVLASRKSQNGYQIRHEPVVRVNALPDGAGQGNEKGS